MSAIYFLWAIPVFGVLVFIHELGHFAVAKFFGIRVHEFALGFGPVVVGFDRGETRYNLRLVPLGGFVRMAGMEDGDVDDPQGFNRKPLYARALVIAAGPIMNFVLAALLFSSYVYLIGVQSSTISAVVPTCKVDGQAAPVQCPAAVAGLQSGDRIVAIEGKPVSDFKGVSGLVSGSNGKPLVFTVRRGGADRQITVHPIQSENRWMVGIFPAMENLPPWQALYKGTAVTGELSVAWLGGLRELVTGRVEVSGPLGITTEIAKQASAGFDSLLSLTGFLSINLGMFNLLPIPALDGSRLVFLGLEGIRGRRLDPQRENMVHFVGFLLLIGLMLVVTYGEVGKMIGR